jgi:prevent-host-death family protein
MMVRRLWPVGDAKNRFAELVEAARRKPQVVTKRGKPVVVVVAADEYERLCTLEKLRIPSFGEMLLAMPRGRIEFERANAAHARKARPLQERIADIGRDALRLSGKRRRATNKRDIDKLWGDG